MGSADRQVRWTFLAVFAAAVIAQGVGAKLLIRLANDTLPAGAFLALAVLAAAYGLLVAGLVRMLAR